MSEGSPLYRRCFHLEVHVENGRGATIFLATATLVAYLGLSDGGLDLLVSGEVGVVAWWAVLVAALVGLVWVGGLGRIAWVAIAALGALALWSALGLTWADSAEQGVTALARLVTYLGLFLLAIPGGRRRPRPRASGGVSSRWPPTAKPEGSTRGR